MAPELKKWRWDGEGLQPEQDQHLKKQAEVGKMHVERNANKMAKLSAGNTRKEGADEAVVLTNSIIMGALYDLGLCQSLPAHSNPYLRSPSKLQEETGPKDSSRLLSLLKNTMLERSNSGNSAKLSKAGPQIHILGLCLKIQKYIFAKLLLF